MRSLLKQFMDRQISRRDFGRGLAGLGLSAAAVESVVGNFAIAQEPPPAEGVAFTGTGGEVLVETLGAAGVRYVFGTTSTGMSAIFDGMTTRQYPQMILSLAESQATSMAHGYELATGETAALLVPGVAVPSTMNNLYNAWKDRSSILVIADSGSSQFEGHNGFQQMENWLEPMVTFTKWRWDVRNERQLAEMIRRAIKVAGTPPGGPVHVRISHDILGAKNVRQTIYPQSRFSIPMEIRPKPELIEQTAKWLLEAESPMISAGPEVTRAGAGDDLIELAEMLGIQVAQGYSCYGDFPFRHPLFAGFHGLGVPRDFARSDVFVNLGGQMPGPALFTAPPPRKAKVVHARIEFEEIANAYPTDIAIAAGLKETITSLNDAIRGMATADRLKSIAGPRLEAAREKQAKADAQRREAAKEYWDASPMSWERLSTELDQGLEDDAIVVPELNYRTPYFWLDLDRGKKRLIGQTTGFALGWGIGAALGVKIAKPDQQVVCIVGDGALLFGQIEALWTAARYDIPIIIVVMNNRSYDNERNRIQDLSPLMSNRDTRDQWRDITCYLGNPAVDFAGLARSFDIKGETVSKPANFRAALKRAKAVTREGRPYVIDALIMQLDRRGVRTEQTWHPEINIAAQRQRRV